MNLLIHKTVVFNNKTQVAAISEGLLGKKDPSETIVHLPVIKADVISLTETFNWTLSLIYCLNFICPGDSMVRVENSGAYDVVSRRRSFLFGVK